MTTTEDQQSIRANAAEVACEKVGALLAPRNIVIAGASDKPNNFSMRVWRNLHRYGFPGAIYPLNPSRSVVWDTSCYRDLASLPETPDHVIALVPAVQVGELLHEAARCGARSATVFAAGFDETHTDQGRELGRELREVISRTGLAVSGPNCLGNYAARSRLMTMTDDRIYDMLTGPVAIVGQSGGVVTAIKRTLNDRGIRVGYVVTSGNEAGLTTADYVYYFAADPDIKVIVCYLEAIRSPAAFLEACRSARAAGKPVVVVKLGGSQAGRAAAQAHTGKLAGATEAFDAVAGEAGALRAQTMDDLIEIVELFLHAQRPKGSGLGAITLSGGLRGLLLDAAEANGLSFPELAPQTRAKLQQILGVGTIIGNPLDAGFAALTSGDNYLSAIRAMLDDPSIDLLLMQEELPRAPGHAFKEENLLAIENMTANDLNKPVAFFSMISYGLDDYGRALRSRLPHLPFVQESEKSLRAVRAFSQYWQPPQLAYRAERSSTPPDATPAVEALRKAAAGPGPTALDEVMSKALLRQYGVRVPHEILGTSPEACVDAARSIGFPVVMKVVSADIAHKSDAGGVKLDLHSDNDVRTAYQEISSNILAYKPNAVILGMIVAPQIKNGLELVLGVQHDPDMGCVVMFGTGGIWLEMFKDVAFGSPALDRDGAARLIDKTKAGQLLDGYRGTGPYDREAVIEALLALGRLAEDLGDLIESIDINPFVALARGNGGCALDGLVVARRRS